MSSSKTDITRNRAFGIRVVDALIDHLRATVHPRLAFPCRTYNVNERREDGIRGKSVVTVTASCSYGSRVELELSMSIVGMKVHATFTADVTVHGGLEQWRGFADEDSLGKLILSPYQTRQVATA